MYLHQQQLFRLQNPHSQLSHHDPLHITFPHQHICHSPLLPSLHRRRAQHKRIRRPSQHGNLITNSTPWRNHTQVPLSRATEPIPPHGCTEGVQQLLDILFDIPPVVRDYC